VHPPSCLVRGEGATHAVAGELAQLSVFVRDRFGNPVTHEDRLPIVAELRGKHRSPVLAQTVDLRTGEYQLSYTAKESGEQPLHVYIRKEPIGGSPFTVLVQAGRALAAQSEVDTSKLLGLRVGVPAAFVVHAYDRHKNRAWRGGERGR
jgi:hypothetical protein